MFFKILKDFWLKTKLYKTKIFFINIVFWVIYLIFFFIFSLFRFSHFFAEVLKVLHFFILNILSFNFLGFLSSKNNFEQNIKGFITIIKTKMILSFKFAFFRVFFFAVGIFILRLFILKKLKIVAMIIFFIFSFLALSFSFLEAEISFNLKKSTSFILSCKKSFLIFLQNPILTLLLFFVQITFQLISVFTLFVLPTWLLGNLIFLTAKKNLSIV